MTPEQFLAKVDFVKQRKPDWFMGQDPNSATMQALHEAEQSPQFYALFSTRLNAEYFALINVFCVDRESDWNIVARNAEFARNGLPTMPTDLTCQPLEP